jgi:nitrate/TMAO reductase-like tetraheme cytochrome c subunit
MLAAVAAMLFFAPGFDGGMGRAQDAAKLPNVIVLGKAAPNGAVAFSHGLHSNGAYKNPSGGPITCVTCHHTAQPLIEATKRPGFKTVWPADRSTTLTAELYLKDPKGAGIAACRDCHVKSGKTPKLMATVPSIQYESSTYAIQLTNQPAFHRQCTECHTEMKAASPNFKGPTAAQCTSCHKQAD